MPLDVEAEMQAIIDVVGGLGDAQVKILEIASREQIGRALQRDAYHVLHLSAHGSPTGVELEDEDGDAVTVSATELVQSLKRTGRPLPLIVLSSCAGAAGGDTGLAIELVRQGADRVIAMQTSVTDQHATALMGRVYALLASENPPVAAALGQVRGVLYEQAPPDRRPEYAVPTLLTAGEDQPLVDLTVPSVSLGQPDAAPSGVEVRELRLGELIGRRAQLRRTLRALRGGPAAEAEFGALSGVVLTGIGGIGKTALAGRVISRLRTDDQPWAVVVHIGRWNPHTLIQGVAAVLPPPARDALLGADDANKLPIIQQLLAQHRLLLVFDDLEQNLPVGGGSFVDAGFAETFQGLCDAAKVGRLLITCRYPVPGPTYLVPVEIPPLTRSELGRLLLRLPALKDLTGEGRKTIVDTIGGHPRLIEFTDALMRGGTTRLREVAQKLRALTATPVSGPAAAPVAVQQAILLGSRDILLAELLDLLSTSERETLLQAAVSRIPCTVDDLAFAVAGRAPSADVQSTVTAAARRLVGLTLLTTVESELMVQPWVAEALASNQDDRLADRHTRAEAMRRQRLAERRGSFDDLTEIARHLAAAERFDDLGAFAYETSGQLRSQLLAATLLGEVLATVPRSHGFTSALMDREVDALFAVGNRESALARAQDALQLATARAEADPDSLPFLRSRSVWCNKLGDLFGATGEVAQARAFYEQDLAIAVRLAQADPHNVDFQRDLSISYDRLGDLARAAGDVSGARGLYEQALVIAVRLAQADPHNVGFQRDLSVSYNRLGDLARAAGDVSGARGLYEQDLAIAVRLAQADPDNVDFQRDLTISYERLGGLAQAAGELTEARRLLEQSLARWLALADSNPHDILIVRGATVPYGRLGDLARDAGDPAEAKRCYEHALAIAERVHTIDPANVMFTQDVTIYEQRLAALAAGG